MEKNLFFFEIFYISGKDTIIFLFTSDIKF